MSDKNIIPSDLLPFFSQIAERMWSGHAAVMIGAGFSKNAKKNDSAQKDFPDWNQLGDVFFEKINGNIPSDEKYLNVLKLADEVQAAFGRSALENILRTEIPDKYYQPSSLHENLMQLPWTDIFTTNYDTLLERTAENITNRRFDVVIKKEDLFYAAKPRIIKLHGSFTAERPLIITEEDYRKYPTEFAPFVNTVQQSLLENTLCLLGFSSDDPNFLKWIGWIRDNLGKQSSPKIYLIGILTLSVGQKNLLVERNIIPLDLSRCRGVNNDHEKAISIFLNFLKDKGEIEEKLDWPNQSIHFFYNPIDPEAQKLMPILKSWISLRKEYPNWLIVPEDRREILKSETDRCHQFIYNLSNEIAPIDIQFLYEYNWRIEKCLMPIDSKLINDYENIVNKYNPFPNIVNIDNAIKPESKNKNEIDWKDITSKWFEIQISMLRYYREEGIHEKWQVISIRLNILIEILEPELQSRYRYERCLYHLFALNIYEVRKELDQWSTNVSLPYWEAKRAGLLSEIGEVFEAEKILETSLITVRKRLNLTPVVNDYSNVSQEAYIMQLLQHVKSASAIIRGTYSVIDDISKSYSERWNALIQYKCDPWLELKLFEAYLDKDSINFKSIEKICGFDIGSTSTIHYYGRGDKYILKAYSFLRYIEEIGFPYHISGTTFGKEAAVGAIKLIAKDSSCLLYTS